MTKQLSEKTGIPLVRYVTALSVGLIAGHCIIIPTPGPMAVVDAVAAPIVSFLLYSLIICVPAALVGGVLYYRLAAQIFFQEQCRQEKDNINFEVDESKELCPGSLALVLILLPITLILVGTTAGVLLDRETTIGAACTFIGDKNIAMFISVVAALFILRPYFKRPSEEMITAACAQSGIVLLITGAGGSFGSIINATGIGDYIVSTMQDFNVPLIILGFVLCQILKVAQGSSTVALVTTSAIVAPSISAVGASPILVGLAICCGAVGLSMPNDSAFWVVNRFSGFTLPQTIKAWTLGGFIAGLTGLVIVLILSMLQNFLPGLF